MIFSSYEIRSLLLVCIFSIPSFIMAQQQRTCATMNYMNTKNRISAPVQNTFQEQNELIYPVRNHKQRTRTSTITIPTVVHIVYKNARQNISDAQVFSQIQVLNEDFRRNNADAINTASDFLPVAADTEIEFCLASLSPEGLPTTGITRTASTQTNFGINDNIKYTDMGGRDIWDASKYLNIWVGEIENGIFGYAQFPQGNPSTDGVVVDYRYFGTLGTVEAPFHLGRTTTHEVGHWLYLFHIWGDGPCNLDDAVADTPIAGQPNYTTPPCTTLGPNSCISATNDLPDMFQNYMDYSADACMNLFTLGQKARMRAMLETGGPRASLLLSNACTAIDIVQDDSEEDGKEEDNIVQNDSEEDGKEEDNIVQNDSEEDGKEEDDIVQNDSEEDEEIPETIPTMSEWGLVLFFLLLLNIGVISIYRLERIRAKDLR